MCLIFLINTSYGSVLHISVPYMSLDMSDLCDLQNCHIVVPPIYMS